MKLKNRYTSNKNYYSYEKDYLYAIKRLIKILNIKNIKEVEPTIKKIRSLVTKEDLQELNVSGVFDYFDSWISSFPVFYISNDLIKIANNTTLPNNISIQNVFIDKAIFLLPIDNDINAKFCVVKNNQDILGNYNDNYITFRFRLNSNFGNQDVSGSIPKHNLNASSKWHTIGDFSGNIGNINNIQKGIESLVAQIFLYMSAYKEKGMKIIKEYSTNNIEFKQGKSKLLTPPTIGFSEEEYVKNQHRLVSVSNPDLQGIKKQTHWRRGHWRQYDDGKLTWVRPCIINPCEV